MKIEHNKDSLACQACGAHMTGLSPCNCHCNCFYDESHPERYEIIGNVEQIRLLLSRDAVLRDFRSTETGDRQW